MNELQDIIYSLVVGLSDRKELSLPRLIKAVYLYDWSATLNSGEKDQRLNWTFSMCGPACQKVEEVVNSNTQLFNLYKKDNHVGGQKEMVRISQGDYHPVLTDAAERAVSHVVRVAKPLKWRELSCLIYSTMPMVMASVGGPLDLVGAAYVRRTEIFAKQEQG